MLASSQEAIQAQMNKVEGSILSQLYKNHIQVGAEPWPAFILGAVGRSWADKHRGQAPILNHTPHRSPAARGASIHTKRGRQMVEHTALWVQREFGVTSKPDAR